LIRQSKGSGARLIAPALILLACSHVAEAQTITVRLINGETGKPLKNLNVTLKWDKELKSSVVFIGSEGTGHAEILSGATGFAMLPGPKMGKKSDRIAFANCNRGPAAILSVQEVIEKGIVPENTCGTKTQKPKPGEIIFWGRPRHFWELDFQ